MKMNYFQYFIKKKERLQIRDSIQQFYQPFVAKIKKIQGTLNAIYNLQLREITKASVEIFYIR